MKKIKRIKWTLVLVLVLSLAFSFAAYSMESLTICTGAVAGSWYPIGGAIAEMVNPLIEEYGYSLTAVPGGGTGNVAVVGNDEAQFGLSYSTNLAMGLTGKYPYEGTPFPKLRAIANLYDMAVHIGVAADTGITTLEDFFKQKNFKFLPDAVATGSVWIFELIAAEYNLTYDDLKKNGWTLDYGGQAFQSSAYTDRHDDGFNVHTNTPNASTYEMTNKRATVFLAIPDNVQNALIEKWGMKNVIIPAGTYRNQDKDVSTVTMPCVLFCSADVPDEVVYIVTKSLCEGKEQLVAVHKNFARFNPETAPLGVGVELHPGAQKYYKEVGLIK